MGAANCRRADSEDAAQGCVLEALRGYWGSYRRRGGVEECTRRVLLQPMISRNSEGEIVIIQVVSDWREAQYDGRENGYSPAAVFSMVVERRRATVTVHGGVARGR